MANIPIFQVGIRRLRAELLHEISSNMKLEGKLVQTDQGIAVRGETSILVFSQTGARFGGLLFYIDQSQGMAAQIERIIDEKKALAWSGEFLDKFKLNPVPPRDQRFALAFETYSYASHAITFDGKERRKIPMGVEVASRIRLNDIPVTGPRAKVRMFFKHQEHPTWMHCCTWSSLTLLTEKDLMTEHDAVRQVRERLQYRKSPAAPITVIDVRLAYHLGEYHGGPDLLQPYYFIEVEFKPAKGEERGKSQGPRQVMQIPAWR